MRFLVFAGLVGISAAVVSGGQPAVLWDAYRQFYPSDPTQRQALDRCFMEDRRFDRSDPAARQECYRHTGAGALPHQPPTPGPKENLVDLRQSAAQGRLPQNDVRTVEQNERYMRLMASERTP